VVSVCAGGFVPRWLGACLCRGFGLCWVTVLCCCVAAPAWAVLTLTLTLTLILILILLLAWLPVCALLLFPTSVAPFWGCDRGREGFQQRLLRVLAGSQANSAPVRGHRGRTRIGGYEWVVCGGCRGPVRSTPNARPRAIEEGWSYARRAPYVRRAVGSRSNLQVTSQVACIISQSF